MSERYFRGIVSRIQDVSEAEEEFRKTDIHPTSVKWTGDAFASDDAHRKSVWEVFFEIDFQIPDGSYISKFHINRDLSRIAKKIERQVDQSKLSIYVQEYSSFSDLRRRADEHIPTSIDQQRVALYAFDYARHRGVGEVVSQFLDSAPASVFSQPKRLREQIIPLLERALLQDGYIVFEPALNKFTEWSDTMNWNNAVQLVS